MTRRVGIAAVALLLGGSVAPLLAQDPGATALRANTVRVQGRATAGFGFIVGIGARKLLIATAWHTVTEEADSTPTICFIPEAATCSRGRVVYVDDPVDAVDPGLDLAIIEVAYPDGLRWRPDVEGSSPASGAPVAFIGRGGDWYVPPVPGKSAGLDATTRLLRYRDLPVAQGVSGALIVSHSAVVAMHVSSDGAFGQGVPIAAIKHRVRERMRASWSLTPPATCGTTRDDALSGVEIVVHVPWRRIAQALPVVAALRCTGADLLLSPAWDGTPLQPEGVVYPRGELRTARIIQAAIADALALDARLGSADKVEVWVH